MRKLHVEIAMESDAFRRNESDEASRILARLADDLDYGDMPRQGKRVFLLDMNGTIVGRVWVTGRKPKD